MPLVLLEPLWLLLLLEPAEPRSGWLALLPLVRGRPQGLVPRCQWRH